MRLGRDESFGGDPGFSLIEVLVSMAVLALLIALIAQMFSSATSVATSGEKRMDADSQAQAVFDRLGLDLALSPRRSDLDIFSKSPDFPQTGNDQIAFFAETPGYFSGGTSGSGERTSVSLVGYRINETEAQLERLGKGLLWNAAAGGGTPLVYLPLKIEDTWPAATDQASDADYELVGPQVFRFEYGYLLKGRTLPDGSMLPALMSVTPWDERPGVGHTAVDGFRDVAAIVVTIAVIDPKSQVLASATELTSLAASMSDFSPSAQPEPGDLEKQWQSAIDSSGLPNPVTSSLRVYHRSFPISR